MDLPAPSTEDTCAAVPVAGKGIEPKDKKGAEK